MKTRSSFFSLALCVVIMAQKLSAQMEKGVSVPAVYIFGYYYNSPYKDSVRTSGDSRFLSRVNLNYGKFIRDNLIIIPAIYYSYGSSAGTTDLISASKSDWYYKSSDYANALGGGIGVAKYKFFTENFAATFGINVSAGFGEGYAKTYSRNSIYNSTTGTYDVTEETKNTYHNLLNFQGGLNAGILFFLNKNLAISGSLGFLNAEYTYSPYQKKKNVSASYTQVFFNPGFNNFGVGLVYYLRPKIQEVSK